MNFEAIKKHTLFSGLSAEELNRALEFFGAFECSYKKGEFLHQIGEPMRCFGLVLGGTVQVYMDEYDGQSMIMATVSEGATFGEAIAFLGTEAPIYICAVTDAQVLWLDPAGVKNAAPEHCELVNRFIASFARRSLTMNDRIQLLSRLTLREKLKTFFSQEAARCGSDSFVIPFDRTDMAAYLGCDRSALSRELGNMRREGIIDFRKNKFTIIKK